VLLFERQRKSVDNAPENFEELSNAIVPVTLVDELEENVVDAFPNKGSHGKEFAVNADQIH
jgi:hypothetical protein